MFGRLKPLGAPEGHRSVRSSKPWQVGFAAEPGDVQVGDFGGLWKDMEGCKGSGVPGMYG